MQWTWTTWTIFEEGHIRIIPTKFGQIQPVVKEEMSFEAIVDNAQRTPNDHNSSPWANGSGELKMVLHYLRHS